MTVEIGGNSFLPSLGFTKKKTPREQLRELENKLRETVSPDKRKEIQKKIDQLKVDYRELQTPEDIFTGKYTGQKRSWEQGLDSIFGKLR